MTKRGKNLALEIGILEAKRGLEPNIQKCKNIAYGRAKRNQISTENLDDQLGRLRQERLSKKIFSVKKHVQRAAKKAKTFSLRRIIKRLKETADEGRKAQLENQMKSLKALSPTSLGSILFAREASRLQDFTDKVTPFCDPLPSDSQEQVQTLEGNTLRKALDSIFTELRRFLQNLYRIEPAGTGLETGEEEADNQKETHTDGATTVTTHSPKYENSGRSRRRRLPSGSPVRQPERNNRKGQRARRAEWERLYGTQARHLQYTRPSGENVDQGHGQNWRHTTEDRLLRSKNTEPTHEKPLHPSWEAKRRQAQAMLAATQGGPIHKKIKFAEEDGDE